MKFYLLLLFSLASLGLNIFLLNYNYTQYNVISVHDGDTFTLANDDRVRLLGVDAPELGRCGADQAKSLLGSLVLGKHVSLKEEKRDTYGRRMALVYVGHTMVNSILLEKGFARPDYTKNTKTEELKAAYRRGSEAKIGIHSPLCTKNATVPPTKVGCTIKGNIDQGTWDKFYHLPTCRHYNQIVLNEDLGEGYFCSESEASAAGFRLAPDCLR
ncbi:thermonuclease family protein [Candidatus Gottesmanbacteria bacterium]|nr:thermonuclease family protein [Candidatus Gottesmanbacteria bacterium]